MRIAVRFAPLAVAAGCVVAMGAHGASSTTTHGCASSAHDASAGWVATLPISWHLLGFSDGARHIGAVGSQFSNVELPPPRLVAGYPTQVNNRALPARGVGLIIATDNDSALSRHDVAALPLPVPGAPRSHWEMGSAPAGEPYMETQWFRIACTQFIATAKIGPAASRGTLGQLSNIIASLHQQPEQRFASDDGLITGSLTVCCDANGSTPEPGTVVIRAPNRSGYVVDVGHSGQFSVSLPPGRYRVVGGIPTLGWQIGRCIAIPARSSSPPAEPAIVKAGARTNVIVNCQGQ